MRVSGAEGVLVFNIGAAALFAIGYAVLALANPSQRRALAFTACYLVGMVSPLSALAAPRLGLPMVTEWVNYFAFLVSTASISIAYPYFHRRPTAWRVVAAVVALGVVLRASIGAQPQDTLLYGLVYQAPFALAALVGARTVLSVQVAPRPFAIALAGVFALIAGLNLVKPLMALALGGGRTLETYTQTAYALVSQLSSGVLLLAAGLLLLLIVAQKAITESQNAAEIDPLSGLLNRRGFDRLANDLVGQAGRWPLAAAMFDLDHFKQINDLHGHAVGDAVIAAAGAALKADAPPDALVGRMGGEEFAILLPGVSPAEARWCVERLRARLAELPGDLPPVTASCGIAQLASGESLADLMRRADLAAYEAKRGGRDRLCASGEDGGRVLAHHMGAR